jgi:4-aminobutyrate aminotransferase-like enzyme
LLILHIFNYVIAHAPDYGLVLDYFLFCNNAFRIAPPLIISEEEILFASEIEETS